MAQPIPARSTRRGLRALHHGHRARGRSREADDHPRNRQVRFQAHRCGFHWLAKNPVELQDTARNRRGAAANRGIAAQLSTTRRAIEPETTMAALRLWVLRDAPACPEEPPQA